MQNYKKTMLHRYFCADSNTQNEQSINFEEGFVDDFSDPGWKLLFDSWLKHIPTLRDASDDELMSMLDHPVSNNQLAEPMTDWWHKNYPKIAKICNKKVAFSVFKIENQVPNRRSSTCVSTITPSSKHNSISPKRPAKHRCSSRSQMKIQFKFSLKSVEALKKIPPNRQDPRRIPIVVIDPTLANSKLGLLNPKQKP